MALSGDTCTFTVMLDFQTHSQSLPYDAGLANSNYNTSYIEGTYTHEDYQLFHAFFISKKMSSYIIIHYIHKLTVQVGPVYI